MLDSLLVGLLAHGADPRPISWDEATANMVKFFVTILIAVVMIYPVLSPLFPVKEDSEAPTERSDSDSNSGLLGWVAIGLMLILSMGWWLTRTSIAELTAEEPPTMADHTHTQERGGQIAMWGDFHAEVARIESGEVRIYLTDSYNRPIAARFFTAEIAAEDTKLQAGTHKSVPALDDSYRFARMSLDVKAYKVKVTTPGWTVNLKFKFDGKNGRHSLPIWCGTPGGAN